MWLSITSSRPRLSKQILTGVTIWGAAANNSTVNRGSAHLGISRSPPGNGAGLRGTACGATCLGCLGAGFGGDGFLCGDVLGNRNDEVDDILVGEARMGVAGHHVPRLRERETAAENGGEVVREQFSRIIHAQDVELGRAAAGTFGAIDFV